MSLTVRCPGCARDVALVDGDQRANVRCPACGLTFARPARPDAITADAPPPPRAIRAGKPERRAAVLTCAQCGEPLRAAAGRDDEPVRCPVCGTAVARRSRQITAKAPQVKAASTHVTAGASPARRTADAEEDGEYRFEHAPRRCPRCDRELEGEAVLCLGCGFNSQTGDQAVREYTPVERTWDGALSLGRRLLLFGAGQVVALAMVGGAILGGFTVAGLAAWMAGTLLLAYVVGTFCRLEVVRNETGHVKVTRAWRCCFVPMRPKRIDLRRYQGVATGMEHGADLWDWIVFFLLVLYGGVPGIVWWYCAFHLDRYYVGLTRDHGLLVLDLYRGWDERAMHDIARVVRDVGGYPA